MHFENSFGFMLGRYRNLKTLYSMYCAKFLSYNYKGVCDLFTLKLVPGCGQGRILVMAPVESV